MYTPNENHQTTSRATTTKQVTKNKKTNNNSFSESDTKVTEATATAEALNGGKIIVIKNQPSENKSDFINELKSVGQIKTVVVTGENCCQWSVCNKNSESNNNQEVNGTLRDFPRPHFLSKYAKASDSNDLQKDNDLLKFNNFGYRKPLEEYSKYTEERKVIFY